MKLIIISRLLNYHQNSSIPYIAHARAICRNQAITLLQEREKKSYHTLNRPTNRHVMFLRQFKEKQLFCGHNNLAEAVILTHVSSNGGISV